MSRTSHPNWGWVWAFKACCALLLLWGIAGVFLYVAPNVDIPRRTDVLFVLAPAGERLEYAKEIMDEGFAGTLAISLPAVATDASLKSAPCDDVRSYRIICFEPDPVTTQGEARALQRLAEENGWKSASVLTAQSHITRARVLIQRCYGGELVMIAHWKDHPWLPLSSKEASWGYIYAYETAAFVKVAVNRDC